MDGGWHGDGRAAVLLASPSNVGVPRPCVDVPLVVYPVAVLNGGVRVVCGIPSSYWVRHPRIVLPSSHCLILFVLFCPSFLLCVVGGEVWWCVQYCCCIAAAVLCCATLSCVVVCVVSCERLYPSLSLFPSLCLLSQYCWFRVVSL